MKASTHITRKERRSLVLDRFLGVDFSSSPINVKKNRASDMKNLINQDGINRKRHGWREILRIGEGNINGIFPFSYVKDVWIVHAGTHFYRVEKHLTDYIPTKLTVTSSRYLDCDRITDTRSQAFLHNGRMYITGCGDYLVYGKWGENYELRMVYDNEDTTIPTTTISIDHDGATDDTNRASKDDVNRLCSLRKNSMLGVDTFFLTEDKTYDSQKEYWVFSEEGYVEEHIYGDQHRGVTIDNPEKTYEQKYERLTWTVDTGKFDEPEIDGIPVLLIEVSYKRGNAVLHKTVKSSYHPQFEDTMNRQRLVADGTTVGYYEPSTGKITFYNFSVMDVAPPVAGQDNITVTFSCRNKEAAEPVRNAAFGTLFGVNGNTDRIFLGGAASHPNIDFHSERDDFTYFGDENTAAYGSDSEPIVAYERLSDNTMAIYKAPSAYDSSIFYRTGSSKDIYDGNGNLKEIQTVFPITAGSIGEAVIARHACANLSGDHLIVSPNGVFGIVLSENIATNERYTRERSRNINERLKRHDLSGAVATVFKGRYYLAVDDVCYIADACHKFTDEKDASYNYEWWFWDHIPVYVWAPIGNELYFGCKDGRICVFDEAYTDRIIERTEIGQLSLDTLKNHMTFHEALRSSIQSGATVVFETEGLYARLAADVRMEGGRCKVAKLENIHIGMTVYADSVGSSGLSVGVPYVIDDIDSGDNSFVLLQKGEMPTIQDGGFSLFFCLTNEELVVGDVENDTFCVKRSPLGAPLPLSGYNEVVPSYITARFVHKTVVEAYWYTPIFDMGTNEKSKTLLKMTVSVVPSSGGQVMFGYETRQVRRMLDANAPRIFSFEDFSFENFTFESEFASSYSVRRNERNFNYIMFRFSSMTDSDLALNGFAAIYKINKENKGVK